MFNRLVKNFIVSIIVALLFSVQSNALDTTPLQHQNNIMEQNNILPMVRASLPSFTASSTNTPSKDMIDVSSWNPNISVEQYLKMKNVYGIKTVVVKITEGTSYVNPKAYSQIHNALEAGLKVNAYHYAHHKSKSGAKKEALYFIKYALLYGLPKNAVCVDDIEDSKILRLKYLTSYTMKWGEYIKKNGYKNISTYASYNTFSKRKLKSEYLGGTSKLWVAAYPYKLSADMTNYSEFSAWQFSSLMKFDDDTMPSGRFDISVLYNSYYGSKNSLKIPTVYKFKAKKTKLYFKVKNYSGTDIKLYIRKKNKRYAYYKKYKIVNRYVKIKGSKYRKLIKRFHKYKYKKYKYKKKKLVSIRIYMGKKSQKVKFILKK